MPELDPMKRWLTWMVYATLLMTLTIDLGLSIRVSMFEHVDWWLGPLPRSPGMGEGGDWWSWPMGVIAKGILRCCQGLFTPVSLGYPLSVFNKNSTLKTNKQSNKQISFDQIGCTCNLDSKNSFHLKRQKSLPRIEKSDRPRTSRFPIFSSACSLVVNECLLRLLGTYILVSFWPHWIWL